jgi:excisionase family DNA binding protein
MLLKTKFIDVETVSSILNIKQRHVYQLIRQKKITAYKPFGGKILFKESEILEVVERSKIKK